MNLESYKHLIQKATFYDMNGEFISYKALPADKKFRVKGIVSDEPFDGECMLASERELWIFGEKYTFVPNDAKEFENAVDMKVEGFWRSYEILMFESQLMPWNEAKALKDAGECMRAYGEVQNHYRLGTARIKTSIVECFIEKDNEKYFCTGNTMYHIV